MPPCMQFCKPIIFLALLNMSMKDQHNRFWLLIITLSGKGNRRELIKPYLLHSITLYLRQQIYNQRVHFSKR